MEGSGIKETHRTHAFALHALIMALLMLLPVAACQHAPPSQPSEKPVASQQPATAAAPAETSATAQPVPGGPHFAVQVAAFEQRAEAEALASRLSEQYGLQTLVAPVEADGETLYRVRLLVRSKDEAKKLANTFLRTEKLKVWIVALP